MLRVTAFFTSFLALTTALPVDGGEAAAPEGVVNATYDGKCFYPRPDPSFQLEAYLGKWYQLAATVQPFQTGCTCTMAEYAAAANGTVSVTNTCQRFGSESVIDGVATPVSEAYGESGVFRVSFPGTPSSNQTCPGPNYIVQEYNCDWAIVQGTNFDALFILSRKQIVPEATVDAYLDRAELLGADLSNVNKTVQTGCPAT